MRGLSGRFAIFCVGLATAGAVDLWSGPMRPAEASSARTVDLTYDVYLGGLHIFTFDVDMALQPDRYSVTAEGGTRGVVGWLYPWDVKLAAAGLEESGRIEPRYFISESDWQRNQRIVHLGFAEDGRYELRQDPPPEPDPDIEGELPALLPDGTVDPLSFAVAATRALQESGRCDQTVPVFDGRRRFDMIVRHVDEATLPPNDYSIYQGPAVRCSLGIERISGFRKSWRSGRQRGAESSAPPTIWVAAIRQDLPPVPVRYDGAIALGNIVIHLTNAAVREEAAGPQQAQ